MKKSGLSSFRALLDGDADRRDVERAYSLGIALAGAGCILLAAALARFLLG